jgi:hypothetical protein
VPVVDVVGVVLVRDGDMSALRAVLVLVTLMGGVLRGTAFVDMVPVDPVEVAVVRIVGVVTVRDRDMAAAFGMGMRMIGVRGVLAGLRHGESPFIGTGVPNAFLAPRSGMGERRLSIRLSIQ